MQVGNVYASRVFTNDFQDFHGYMFQLFWKTNQALFFVDRKSDGTKECIYFAMIEVENYGQLIVRTYYTGISRKGRVKEDPTIELIAKGLDWSGPAEELLEYWTGEESPEKALKNKIEHKGLYKKSA